MEREYHHGPQHTHPSPQVKINRKAPAHITCSGLEADQKVIAAHGCYAMTATTALTAQNTTGVSAIHTIPPAFLRKQIDAVFDDLGVDVVKTGMLAGAETVSAVAAALQGRDFRALVVDPVMIATTGAELLPHTALREMRERLLPRATVVTPNVPEAKMLLADAGVGEVEVESVEDLEVIGAKLLTLGMEWVLVKGGHVPFRKDYSIARTAKEKQIVVDVLIGKDGECVRMETGWKNSTSTHGTGCSLACELCLFPNDGEDTNGPSFISCNCVESGERGRRPRRCASSVQICGGRYQDRAWIREGEWAVEPFSLDSDIALCAVSPPPPLMTCPYAKTDFSGTAS